MTIPAANRPRPTREQARAEIAKIAPTGDIEQVHAAVWAAHQLHLTDRIPRDPDELRQELRRIQRGL